MRSVLAKFIICVFSVLFVGSFLGGCIDNVTLSGIVVDNDSGSPVDGAIIIFPDGEEIFCDSQGGFSIEIAFGESEVFTVNADGYKPTLVCVNLTSSRNDAEIPMILTTSDDLPPIISLVDAQMEIQGKFARVEATTALEPNMTYLVKKGWNQISFPFISITGIENTSQVNNVLFHFNPETNSYDFAFLNNPEGIRNGYGYWLYVEEDTELSITGDFSTQAEETIQIKKGYNCIGLPYNVNSQQWGLVQVAYQGATTAVAHAINEGWFGPVLFWYDPGAEEYNLYFVGSDLEPQKGYWLYSLIDCSLVFSEPDGETGILNGLVTNLETANPVKDATVSIDESWDTTDSEGYYVLYDVPAGQQTLVATAIGYDDYTQAVNITPGKVTTCNFSMNPISAIYTADPK